MKFTKLKVVWRFEFANCHLILSLDFEKHRAFFYFNGSGEPTKSEMRSLELLVHTYDNEVGEFPKTGLKKEEAYCVAPTRCYVLGEPLTPLFDNVD